MRRPRLSARLPALTVALAGCFAGRAMADQPGYLSPSTIKLSPDGAKAYIVCEEDNSLLVLDTRTRRIAGKVKTGQRPRDVAVSPDGKTLYVSNEWSGTVSEIDAGRLSIRRTLKTGWGPIGVTTDRTGNFLYVANSAGDNISVLGLSRGVEVKKLAASRSPHWVSLSRDGQKVYVSNLLPRIGPPDQAPVSELTVIDAGKQVVAERIPIPGAIELQHIAEAPEFAGGYLLVPLVRPKNLNPLVQVAQGWIVTHGLAVIERSKVAQVLTDDIDYYYAGGSGVAFTPDGKLALVTASDANVVSIIGAGKLTALLRRADPTDLPNRLDSAREFVLHRTSCGANPTAVAVSPDGRTAYVVNRLDDSVTVLDLGGMGAPTRVDLGGPKRITPARRGEQLFHDASYGFQGQFSCATCHPENHVDGLAWNLETPQLGRDRVLNRTLRGLSGTAPFKWSGRNPDLKTQCGVRAAKFVFRSEGFNVTELDAMAAFLNSVPLPPNRRVAANGKLTPAQKRGKKIYFGKRCDTCHPPQSHYTTGRSADVGTGTRHDTSGVFDIPQLDRVYDRPPYLHTGQALSLEEIWTKFNVQDKHGVTSDMTKEELNDLVEYLKTL
jgi:YVTN family beta-propeller protein